MEEKKRERDKDRERERKVEKERKRERKRDALDRCILYVRWFYIYLALLLMDITV